VVRIEEVSANGTANFGHHVNRRIWA
jgi:hypothetical protein